MDRLCQGPCNKSSLLKTNFFSW